MQNNKEAFEDVVIGIESYMLDSVFPGSEKNSILTLILVNRGEKLGNGKIQLMLPKKISLEGKVQMKYFSLIGIPQTQKTTG